MFVVPCSSIFSVVFSSSRHIHFLYVFTYELCLCYFEHQFSRFYSIRDEWKWKVLVLVPTSYISYIVPAVANSKIDFPRCISNVVFFFGLLRVTHGSMQTQVMNESCCHMPNVI